MRLIEARKRAVEILESVTPGSIGDSRVAAVCQGRERSKRYSGCADLAHYLYWELGLRGHNVNREDSGNGRRWRVGLNVSLLAGWPGVARHAPENLEGVDGGDVLICWSTPEAHDEHVVCVLAEHPDGTISTAEYGQSAPKVGRLFTRAKAPRRPTRPWRIWLPLGSVLALT